MTLLRRTASARPTVSRSDRVTVGLLVLSDADRRGASAVTSHPQNFQTCASSASPQPNLYGVARPRLSARRNLGLGLGKPTSAAPGGDVPLGKTILWGQVPLGEMA